MLSELEYTVNAKIEKTTLGPEDHGILTCWLHLTWPGSGQGFGGYDLRGPWCPQWIEGILKAVGVSKWEDLPGKSVRARGTRNKLTAIGHIVEDRWFEPVNLEVKP